MLPAELFQHLGVGRIPSLGLLVGGQAQLVEQDLAQLLGGVDVELLPGQVVDAVPAAVDALGQHLAELGQRLPVDAEAALLHLRQHRAEGQFYRVQQIGQPLGFQLWPHLLVQRADGGGVAEHGGHGFDRLV